MKASGDLAPVVGGPAAEQLAAHHPAPAQVDDRLDEGIERADADRTTQLSLEVEALLDLLAQVVVEDPDLARPARLGVVHGHVGVAQVELAHVVGVEEGDADGRRHRDAVVARRGTARPGRAGCARRAGRWCRSRRPPRPAPRTRHRRCGPRGRRRAVACRIRSATSRSTWSPTWWPCVSLTALNRSRSMNSSPMPLPDRFGPGRSPSSSPTGSTGWPARSGRRGWPRGPGARWPRRGVACAARRRRCGRAAHGSPGPATRGRRRRPPVRPAGRGPPRSHRQSAKPRRQDRGRRSGWLSRRSAARSRSTPAPTVDRRRRSRR